MTGSVWWPELHSHTAPIRKQAQLCSPHRPPPSVGLPSQSCSARLGGAGGIEPCDKHSAGSCARLRNDTQGRLF